MSSSSNPETLPPHSTKRKHSGHTDPAQQQKQQRLPTPTTTGLHDSHDVFHEPMGHDNDNDDVEIGCLQEDSAVSGIDGRSTDVVGVDEYDSLLHHQQKQEKRASNTKGDAGDAGDADADADTDDTVMINRAEVFIEGMTCTMCSKSVENSLRSNVPGIVSVEISLTTDTAEVAWTESDDTQTDSILQTIHDSITNIGYNVEDIKLITKNGKGKKLKSTKNSKQGVSRLESDVSCSAVSEVATLQNRNDALLESGYCSIANNHHEEDEEYDDDDNVEEEVSVEERWHLYRQRQIQKLNQRRRGFLFSLAGTLPILILTMLLPYVVNTDAVIFHHRHISVFHKYNISVQSLVLWILATPVQFLCGYDFYRMAWYGLRTGTAGMDVLVALGTTASYGYAVVVGVFGLDDHAAHFFETSAVLICFVLAGKWMQAIAVRRTSDALSSLMELQSRVAVRVVPIAEQLSFNPLIDPFVEETVDINLVKVHDIVKVIRGASIPADGIVLFGEMLVNESMVTGESMPALKTPGSLVLGGTVCVETCATILASTQNDDNCSNITGFNGSKEDMPEVNIHDEGDPSNNLQPDQEQEKSQRIGAAFVQVTGVGSNTALAQIVKMVQQAQTRSVPIQSFADAISAVFVPTVCVISVITYLVWYALCSSNVVPASWYVTELGEDAATFSLMFAIACLVISCPCALGLATPTAVMVGTGVGASKCGVLMKGGQALEIASQVNTVILDKTGTLTKGTPTVSDFVRINSESSNEDFAGISSSKDNDAVNAPTEFLLWVLASVERTSEHPLAKAVVSFAESRLGFVELEAHPLAQPKQFRAMTGRGCTGIFCVDQYYNSGTVPNTEITVEVAVGNRAYANISNITIPTHANDCMIILERQGKTAIFGAINGQVCVILGIADELKSDASASIRYLREHLKIDVWMVTGDNARTASAVASKLDIPPNRVVSEALPATKLAIVERLQGEGRIVAMVGDGVNDSPALAQADVGMSLGSGASEIAAEASDMVLVRGDMASVCTAIHLSRAIFRRIQWNFVWSLLYNVLGIPVAAGVFYPFVHARLPPTVAALAMALSSVSVVLSSLTLRLYRPPDIVVEENAIISNPINRSERDTLYYDSREEEDELRVSLISRDSLVSTSESTILTDNRSTRSISGLQEVLVI